MRVLITGITGMVGSHLAEYCLTLPGVEVFGTFRWRSRLDNLDALRAAGRLNTLEGVRVPDAAALARYHRPGMVTLLECDLADPYSVRDCINAVRPERIFHLAAQSFVPTSWHAPQHTLLNNQLGQLHLFEAVRQAQISPRIHIAGSSEEYGLVHEHEIPIRETNPLRPLSPYAVSKVGQEMLAYQYHKSYGLWTLTTRAFNHTGPRRGHTMATSSFARQIAEIEAGLREPVILVGNLDSRRDWTDVRDVCRAYWLALEKGQPGEVYNIASGVPRRIGDMLEDLLRLSPAQVEVRVDEGRLRPSDVTLLHGDYSKFHAATGWVPEIPWEQTLRDLLDYWRERVRAGKVISGVR